MEIKGYGDFDNKRTKYLDEIMEYFQGILPLLPDVEKSIINQRKIEYENTGDKTYIISTSEIESVLKRTFKEITSQYTLDNCRFNSVMDSDYKLQGVCLNVFYTTKIWTPFTIIKSRGNYYVFTIYENFPKML